MVSKADDISRLVTWISCFVVYNVAMLNLWHLGRKKVKVSNVPATISRIIAIITAINK